MTPEDGQNLHDHHDPRSPLLDHLSARPSTLCWIVDRAPWPPSLTRARVGLLLEGMSPASCLGSCRTRLAARGTSQRSRPGRRRGRQHPVPAPPQTTARCLSKLAEPLGASERGGGEHGDASTVATHRRKASSTSPARAPRAPDWSRACVPSWTISRGRRVCRRCSQHRKAARRHDVLQQLQASGEMPWNAPTAR